MPKDVMSSRADASWQPQMVRPLSCSLPAPGRVRRVSVKRVQAAHLGESSLEAAPPRVLKLSFLREDYCNRPNSVWRRVEKKIHGRDELPIFLSVSFFHEWQFRRGRGVI
jgi:hypothetical protein